MAGRDPNRLELRRALAKPDQQTPLTHEPLAPTPLPPTHLVKQNKNHITLFVPQMKTRPRVFGDYGKYGDSGQ